MDTRTNGTPKGNKMRTKAVREHFGKEDESSTITLTQVNAIHANTTPIF